MRPAHHPLPVAILQSEPQLGAQIHRQVVMRHVDRRLKFDAKVTCFRRWMRPAET